MQRKTEFAIYVHSTHTYVSNSIWLFEGPKPLRRSLFPRNFATVFLFLFAIGGTHLRLPLLRPSLPPHPLPSSRALFQLGHLAIACTDETSLGSIEIFIPIRSVGLCSIRLKGTGSAAASGAPFIFYLFYSAASVSPLTLSPVDPVQGFFCPASRGTMDEGVVP